MTPEVLRLFTEDGPDEVVLPECSQLAPAALAEALVPCATPRYAHRSQIYQTSPGIQEATLARALLVGAHLSPSCKLLYKLVMSCTP